jgi:hypothetical protein
MLVKILGAIDVIAGLILIINIGSQTQSYFYIILGVIVMSKSLLGMLKDFGSWVDLLAGLALIISSLIGIPLILGVIFGIFILQKGIFSFLS